MVMNARRAAQPFSNRPSKFNEVILFTKAKQNIALFPEDWVAKKSLNRAATKIMEQMEIQMKKENKHWTNFSSFITC